MTLLAYLQQVSLTGVSAVGFYLVFWLSLWVSTKILKFKIQKMPLISFWVALVYFILQPLRVLLFEEFVLPWSLFVFLIVHLFAIYLLHYKFNLPLKKAMVLIIVAILVQLILAILLGTLVAVVLVFFPMLKTAGLILFGL